MAKRKAIQKRSEGEGIPMPHQDKHEKMMGDIHDALYSLGSKIRKPMTSNGDKLLPKALRPTEPEGAKMARAHIERLHSSMQSEK